MDSQDRRSDPPVLSKLSPKLSPDQPPSIQNNFGDFVYRDAISRKQYQYRILQIKKKKLTVNQIKHHQSSQQTKSVIQDVGGHLQILSNIKQFRFHQLLSSSKELKRIKQQMSMAQLSKYNQYKQSLLKIRSNMIQSISNYNMDSFRKYMIDGSSFDPRLNIMKRIQNNKITQEELERFLRESNEEYMNKESTNIEQQERRKVLQEVMGRQIGEEFEGKYRKQYDGLEREIKNRINGQVKYLVEPESVNYKSVKQSIKPGKKAGTGLQEEFERTVEEIKSKSLNLVDKFVSLQEPIVETNKENCMNLQFLKSLIVEDNTFDLKCQLNDRPQYIELTDAKGNSLLHIAVKESRLDAAKILISCGINTDMKNKLGYTALEITDHFNQPEIKKVIEKHNNRYNTNY